MKKMCCFTTMFCVLWLAGCQKELKSDGGSDMSYTVRITFEPVVNEAALVLAQQYRNAFGEDYTVTAFRFYTGYPSFNNNNLVLPVTSQAKYHLADAGIAHTLSLDVSVADSIFNGFSFQVGVDSLDNVSGAQGGDLDPAKGMFWTWNSGYVMAKLEGTSSFSSVPDGNFTYHVGGYGGENKAIRRITLSTPGAQQIKLQKGHTTELIIHADIEKWFNSAHALRIADHSFLHSPGALAKQYADNYATMFRIAEIISE